MIYILYYIKKLLSQERGTTARSTGTTLLNNLLLGKLALALTRMARRNTIDTFSGSRISTDSVSNSLCMKNECFIAKIFSSVTGCMITLVIRLTSFTAIPGSFFCSLVSFSSSESTMKSSFKLDYQSAFMPVKRNKKVNGTQNKLLTRQKECQHQ